MSRRATRIVAAAIAAFTARAFEPTLAAQGGPPCEVATIRNLVRDGERMGYVAAVGDLDRDGVLDFLLGATAGGTNGGGYVRPISGRTTKDFPWRVEGPLTQGQGGVAMCGAWDVNHDGWPDFAVGWSFAGPSREGRVDLHSGRDGTILRSWSGALANDNFGHAVASSGDIDGNGHCDIVVGALQYTAPTRQPGYVEVYDAETGQRLVRLAQRPAPIPGANFGYAVGIAAGLDGDDYDDILVGAPAIQVGSGNCIQAFLGGGSRLGQLHYSVYGTDPARVGAWLFAEDMNADSVKDYITNLGPSVVVYSGASQGTVLWQAANAPRGSEYGAAGDVVRDVTNDGTKDLVVSATYGGSPGSQGFVRVLDGRTGATIQEYPGLPSVSYYGGSLAASRAAVSTQSADFFVGAPYDPNGSSTPSAQRGTAVLYALPGSCATYGEGCPTSLGQTPRVTCSTAPRAGSTFTLRVDRAPPLLPTAGAWMLSGQRAFLPLDFIGMRGCVALTGTDLFIGFSTNALGESTLPIDLGPHLRGQCLYAQALVIDMPPYVNPRGLVVSNGIVGVIL